jgi:hypothetical protein
MLNDSSRARACAPGKPMRTELVRLSVSTDHCPQVAQRVLGLIAQQSIVPATIAHHIKSRTLALDIVFERPSTPHCEALLAKVGELGKVRRARLMPLR